MPPAGPSPQPAPLPTRTPQEKFWKLASGRPANCSVSSPTGSLQGHSCVKSRNSKRRAFPDELGPPDGPNAGLSQTHDYPLLRQVLRSRFATHSQLYEFMRLGRYERDRRVFNWRLRRLVTHGLVLKHPGPSLHSDSVYSISTNGGLLLQGTGECFVPLPAPRGAADRELKLLHAVELNDIRLTLLQAGAEIPR